LQQARSLSFPFGILEQQSGPGGQMGYLLRTPRPGQMRLWAWQSVAHGAKLLSFFRWRTCPYGAEQHWHGLLDPDDRGNRRIAEAKQIAGELQQLPTWVFDAPVTKCIAVLRDFDNETNERRINTYTKHGEGEFWRWINEASRRHLPADFVWPGTDLSGYRVLVAPHVKIVDDAMVRWLIDFVQSGGTLVLTAQSGSKDRNCHLVEMPLPGLLRELAGVEVEDWTTLGEKETRQVSLEAGTQIMLDTFVERLKPCGAEPIGRWATEDTLLAASPAVTRHRIGRGVAYYVGGYCATAAVAGLLVLLMGELGPMPTVDADPEVEVIQRRSPSGRCIWLLNHSPVPRRVSGIPAGREVFSGQSAGEGTLLLAPHGVAVVLADAVSGPSAATAAAS
jgi:beta-galactosidase